ncbi:MAG: hypothetical protein PHW87_08335 [Methanothrix sp.]|nr:hypothetical protein [Methanothrix sp.]
MVRELFKKSPKNEETCCMPGEGMSDAEFASFCKTPEAIKRIPNGRLEYPDGTIVYIDGAGQPWTREQWKKRFGYDPKKIWNRMKKQKIAILGWNSEKEQSIAITGKYPAQKEY